VWFIGGSGFATVIGMYGIFTSRKAPLILSFLIFSAYCFFGFQHDYYAIFFTPFFVGGKTMSEKKCIEYVTDSGGWYRSQCGKKAGHGSGGFYCKRHASRHPSGEEETVTFAVKAAAAVSGLLTALTTIPTTRVGDIFNAFFFAHRFPSHKERCEEDGVVVMLESEETVGRENEEGKNERCFARRENSIHPNHRGKAAATYKPHFQKNVEMTPCVATCSEGSNNKTRL
jgi:hypothetical protein